MENKKLSLNFEDSDEVSRFIKETESGIYSGVNIDNESVVVMIEKGKGMNVERLQSNGWWCVHEYDEFGYLVSESYKK